MKRSLGAVLFSVCLLSGFSTLLASTNVPSILTQDTRWEASGSPYLIQGKVAVPKSMTLSIGPGVQVVFQGAAAMEVNGTLTAEGTATSPVVFNMTEGVLQSELFINGGQAALSNVKILSGVFLIRDSQLVLQGSEITKGSGVYLQGSTEATLNNNKIYGCATGLVLDGTVKATATFNTLVQNTYGLYLKGFSEIKFQNNSVHDNQVEIINNTPAASLGGNYWGTEDDKTVLAKVQGNVKLAPMKSLKDILRFYIRTQLPVISSKQEAALIAKEKKIKLDEQLALKKLKQKEGEEALAARQGVSKTTEVVEAPPAEEEAAAGEVSAPKAKAVAKPKGAKKVAAKEPAVVSAPIPDPIPLKSHTEEIKVLPPAAQTLKPLASLPPDQGNVSEIEGTTTAAVAAETAAEEVPAPQPEAAPAAVAAAPETGEIPPAPPDVEVTSPDQTAQAALAPESVPVPPTVEPPPLTTEVSAPAAPAVPIAAAVVEPKPVSKEVTPTASQASAVEALQGTAGDIEGMLVPPLDLSLEIAAPASATTSHLQPDSSSNTETSKKTNGPFDESLTLPPIQNTDIEPPKDLEIPPPDDMGKVDLDSRNK
jgi:parallel beta-helix repeat protein